MLAGGRPRYDDSGSLRLLPMTNAEVVTASRAAGAAHVVNSPGQVLFASLIGTTIEFFDFYIYATAAVLVFPHLFFPTTDPTSAILQSFATFALAFFARPIGSALFGHFGDRIGRKATQVAALLATENAPPGKRALYGMFPQLGAPIGFLCSSGTFLLLTSSLDDTQLLEWGWRVPFLASALLVFVGLYVRLRLTETPAFQQAIENNERVRVPIATLIVNQPLTLVLATLASTTTFVLFYLMTVFSLSWATTALHFSRPRFLILQMAGVLFFAATIPISAILADRRCRRGVLIASTVAIGVFGLMLGSLFGSGTGGALLYLCIGFAVMGFTYGPLGTFLGELFPTSVRYTGASVTFNLAGILGASLAPYLATYLAAHFGLVYVGWYLAGVAVVTLVALLLIRER